MAHYSDMRRHIETHSNTALANRYLELLHLIHGEKCEERLPPIVPEDRHRKNRPRRVKSSKPSFESEASHGSTATTTLASEENLTRGTTEEYEKWLRTKNAALRKAKKQERRQKKQEKLEKEEEIRQNEERLKQGKLAFEEWLDKKSFHSAKQPLEKSDSQSKLPTGEETTDAAAEPEEPSKKHDDSLDKEANFSETHSIPDNPDNVKHTEKLDNGTSERDETKPGQVKPNERTNEEAKTSNKAHNKGHVVENSTPVPKRSEEPVTSKSSKQNLTAPSKVTGNLVPDKGAKVKTETESPEHPTPQKDAEPHPDKKTTVKTETESSEKAAKPQKDAEVHLKKNITFDEWLKIQRSKSALQRTTVKEEHEELRASLQKMTKEKIPARQRVENILNENTAEEAQPTKENGKENGSIPCAPESKRFSNETLRQSAHISTDSLRQSAAATHEWPKKPEPSTSEGKKPRRPASANPVKGSSNKSSDFRNKMGEETVGERARRPASETPAKESSSKSMDSGNKIDEITEEGVNNQQAHGNVTASLDETAIDNNRQVFSLTEVSQS